jgi:signal transduction histidine kinase
MATATWDRRGDLAAGSPDARRAHLWRRRFPWSVAGHLGLGVLSGVCAPLVLVAVLGAMVIGRIPRLFARGEALLARLVRGSARLEAVRFADLLGVAIDAPPDRAAAESPAQDGGRLSLTQRERAVAGYWLVRPVVSAGELVILVPVLGVPIAVAAGIVLGWPEWRLVVGEGSGAASPNVDLVWLSAGVVILVAWLRLVAGPTTVALGRAEAKIAGWLLGGREAALVERVQALATSRDVILATAEEERRRIERDLHDGAQQRLVALTILLGRAQARLGEREPEVADLIASAKAESRSATAELRDLTRGLHPPVLADRGLDAALSAIAARSPVPVEVVIDLAVRPSIAVESTIYFAVAEALTNVAKHSEATAAVVTIRQVGDVLVTEISDDGRGGAAAAGSGAGSGLRGIVDRLRGIDGRLRVASPPGGPTVLTIEVPHGG